MPCIERCAFGAVKAWTAFAIASNEIAIQPPGQFRRNDPSMAQTAKEMNSKYKETSEAGLALQLCSADRDAGFMTLDVTPAFPHSYRQS